MIISPQPFPTGSDSPCPEGGMGDDDLLLAFEFRVTFRSKFAALSSNLYSNWYCCPRLPVRPVRKQPSGFTASSNFVRPPRRL